MIFGNRLYYLAGALVLLMIVASCAYVKNSADSEAFEFAKRGIMLRNVGHLLLLQSGDSTSRVLPVKQIAENEYQLQFENKFTFQTDSLVKTIKSSLARNDASADYVVNVIGCSSPQVIFGYAVLNGNKNNVIPCSGRKQPVDCYRVNILFKNKGISARQTGYLVGGLPLLAFIGLLLFKPKRKDQIEIAAIDQPVTSDIITIGKITFDKTARNLTIGHQSIQLTVKESKLLLIFAQSPNQMIDRARLQKEIWEDEGVIVGRSLDMFISRLRKKLEADPSVKLINIHGKGFRLETL
ncbi:winged helix-turn-helix transcriptional regulator [Mucilaginibacter mali]|uniref:Winged helix-turn-helix transcriptional regulator n=1 Tax=Mucilaginibacter mali TaxID=2740462 RepID=A0A7D4Q9H4_9SPHI|nr:winged helix-turn-helix domain-containing protein [Mucilaginibacter mali]QKJ30165.1 winged helix-turn-helix transcriptional regulator [Mucilaginibacter mali]